MLKKLATAKIVPIVTIYEEKEALNLAKALIDGGATALEVTLRSPFGLNAIKQIKKEFPKTLVAAGTVTNIKEFEAALKVGADFIITPGFSEKFAQQIAPFKAAVLPGVATASDIMSAAECGYYTLKFYHAVLCGGVEAIKAYSKPFSHIKFIPTGGINASNAREFLSHPNVVALGSSSWVNPKELVLDKNYERITLLTKKAFEI